MNVLQECEKKTVKGMNTGGRRLQRKTRQEKRGEGNKAESKNGAEKKYYEELKE